MIGYGPDPEDIVSIIREREIPTIMGNHELILVDPHYLEWFNPLARESIKKTIPKLSKDSINFITHMQKYITSNGAHFVHGFPPDSALTYLFQIEEPAFCDTFENMQENICFVGHTHKLEIVSYSGGAVIRGPLKKGILNLNDDKKYIINAGSVGQPRDGNNNAKYLIWDTTENTIEVRYIPYHIAKVTNKIIDAGLPEAHAHRLW
jgi:diadenosine tetraphosphatase ApaH/serine/threonine PP2A family protein phosphatase